MSLEAVFVRIVIQNNFIPIDVIVRPAAWPASSCCANVRAQVAMSMLAIGESSPHL